MVNSFTEKRLRAKFILAGTNQVFPGTNSNTLELTGLRMSAKVRTVARLATDASLRIWGMLPADMNALSVIWANPPVIFDHIVIIEANSGSGWTQVFKGTIREAQPEYRAAPDVYFHVQAQNGYFKKIEIDFATPTSYPGSVTADIAILDLIDRMGYVGDVTGEVGSVTITNPYWSGTLFDQFVKACQAAGADFYFLGDTVLVTASGKPRDDQPAVVLNSQSGLIGYPVYERAQLNVDALFSAAFLCGTPIELTSSVPNATGRWYPFVTEHTLDCLMPKGRWLSQLQCLRVSV
jgi:hypothetical protein